MRRAGVVAVAALVSTALLGLGQPTVADEGTAPVPAAAAFTVDDARLTWGLNDESNNKAFAPGTVNFLSAGAVPDPGRGGQAIVAPGVWRGTSTTAWRAVAGDVALEKQRPDGSFAPATFAGLSTAVDGSPLTSTTGPFSGHRLVLSGGDGVVDPEAGTATLRWTGSFSVVFYSGFTFFTVRDPALVVADGSAQLRATLTGYAADRDDPTRWSAVAPRQVVLADLPDDLVLPAAGGFTARPDYLGVRYDAPDGGTEQVRQGEAWGAFPASFLAYLDRVGSASFWFSSGGSADAHKMPHPLTVSYDAAAPVEPPAPPVPTPQPTAQPTTPVNPEPPTPVATPTPTPTATPAPAAAAPPAAPSPPIVAPPSSSPVAAGATAPVPTATAPTTVLASSAASAVPEPDPDPPLPTWQWWTASALLLGAAALTLLTQRSIRSKGLA